MGARRGRGAVQPTPHPAVNALLRDLLARLEALFGDELAAAWLHGSVVEGGFDPDFSDVDLLVACTGDVEKHIPAIDRLHRALVLAHPEWDDRVDVVYASTETLLTFRSRSGRIAFISPGEPLHLLETNEWWILKWHSVQEAGVALFGPPPRALIAATTHDEYESAVRAHVRAWPEWIAGSDRPGFHAYAVLSLCRALHLIREGEQVSKPRAADWAARAYPAWSAAIRNALAWRRDRTIGVSDLRAAEFVAFASREIQNSVS